MKRLKSLKSLRIGDLKISLPIVQGGMGVGISLSGLASANEGGVGVISSAGLGLLYRRLSPDYCKASILGLKEELRKARERTRGVIGVNVMVAMSNFADMVRTSIAERADIIFSGAGLPLDLPSYLDGRSRTKLVPIVSSVRAFRLNRLHVLHFPHFRRLRLCCLARSFQLGNAAFQRFDLLTVPSLLLIALLLFRRYVGQQRKEDDR